MKKYWAIGTGFIILGLLLGLVLLSIFQTKVSIYFAIFLSLIIIFVGISFLQKQFLKPDWRKIVIFAIIFIILVLAPTIQTFIPILGCQIGQSNCPGSYIYYTSFYEEYLNNIFSLNQYGGYNLNIFLINFFEILIVYLLISYFVSCLIVWTSDKIRKKKK